MDFISSLTKIKNGISKFIFLRLENLWENCVLFKSAFDRGDQYKISHQDKITYTNFRIGLFELF